MQVTPGAQPAPQAPAQGQAPGPQGAPQGGPSPAAQLVGQIHQGLMQLSKMIQGAGPAVSPEDKQRVAAIVSEFEALVSDLGKPPGQGPAQPPAPQGPRPDHAGATSRPGAGY